MSIIPTKYHDFISPPLRRVFLDTRRSDSSNTRAMMTRIESLNAEIAALKERIKSLKRDKDLIKDRYDSAQSELTRLRAEERAARLASRNSRKARADRDALKDKKKLKRLRAKFLFFFFFGSCMTAWCDTCQLVEWWSCGWKGLVNGVGEAFHVLQMVSTEQRAMLYNKMIYPYYS